MDPNVKKTTLRMIPYGLYVLTAADKGGKVAAGTVNWVTQASFEPPPRMHGAVYSSDTPLSTMHAVPDRTALQRAADVLNAGERVAILIGQGAKGAVPEVEQVAEVLGGGVAKALAGQALELGITASESVRRTIGVVVIRHGWPPVRRRSRNRMSGRPCRLFRGERPSDR